MKINLKRTPESILSIKTLLIVGVAFIIYLVANLLYLSWISNKDIKNFLVKQNARISGDLIYKNDKWNTSSYINDYKISLTWPLYIITSEGYAVDRETPINGFLDFSNFSYDLSFQTPKTIKDPANQNWRVYSKVISDEFGKTVGAIFIGYYEPDLEALKNIDSLMEKNADKILSSIKVNGESIDASHVDSRSVSIFLSYEIVDKYNRTLQIVGGPPSYIDRSYIAPYLKGPHFFTIKDSKTEEPYQIYSNPIISNGVPIAAIFSGYPLAQINKDFNNQLIFSISTVIVVIVILIFFLSFFFKREFASLFSKVGKTVQKVFYVSHRSGAFSFDQDTGSVYLEGKKIELRVGSLQYHICKILFSKSNKNWPDDEIIDKLPEGIIETDPGDDYRSDRGNFNGNLMRKKFKKVSDAIRLIDQKGNPVFGCDVILVQNRTYRINPNVSLQTE